MPTDDDILNALRNCVDPEVGLSIVDMGFVQGIELNGGTVHVKLITGNTSCPFHPFIVQRAYDHISKVDGVEKVVVEVLQDVQWSPSMLTDRGREFFGL